MNDLKILRLEFLKEYNERSEGYYRLKQITAEEREADIKWVAEQLDELEKADVSERA